MKAISLWQPFASLWLSPRKVHETRHWPTRHRGWIAVHAAKRFEKDFDPHEPMGMILAEEFGAGWAKSLPTGAILGAVYLDACVQMKDTRPASDDDYDCGNWSDERFAWHRTETVKLPQPVPYRGHQGLFDIPYLIVPTLPIPGKQP